MAVKRGIVVKIKDSYCIVVTPDGTYKKVPSPSTHVKVGMEIGLHNKKLYRYFKPAALIAAALAIALCISMFNYLLVPQAAAYVSLDINPSVELAVDEDLTVTNVKSFNKDGTALIENLQLEEHNIDEAIQLLIKEAVRQNYLSKDKEGLIVATVSQPQSSYEKVITNKLTGALVTATTEEKVKAKTTVYEVDETLHESAQKEGLTAGKFIIYQQAKSEKADIKNNEIKATSIYKFTDQYKIHLLPNDKVIVMKKHKNIKAESVELDQLLKQNQLNNKLKSGHDEDNTSDGDHINKKTPDNVEQGDQDKDRDKNQNKYREQEKERGSDKAIDNEEENKNEDKKPTNTKNNSQHNKDVDEEYKNSDSKQTRLHNDDEDADDNNISSESKDSDEEDNHSGSYRSGDNDSTDDSNEDSNDDKRSYPPGKKS